MPTPDVRRAAAACALLLVACATEPPPAPSPPAAPPPVAMPEPRYALPMQLTDAPRRCAALAQAPPAGVAVARAESIPAGVARPLDAATGGVAVDALPAHCRVNGRFEAAGAAPVAFEMRLPSDWNGRFFHQGRDGGLPVVVEAYGHGAGAGGLEDNALSRGYAVLSSGAGHVDPSSASAPAQARAEADAALHRAAVAAQTLIAAHYGKPPDRSYHVGCAEGGRDGLLFAQRWPALFDGIVAVAPTLRPTDAALASVWTLQRLSAVAPRSRQREPVLARTLTPAELFTVAQAVLAQCDAMDGAEDGFVMDMAGCRFDPAVLACRRGQTKDCLRPARVRALGESMAGPRDASGQPLYVPWPWDPGLAAPGWRAWNLGFDGPAGAPEARHVARASAVLGRAFARPPAPKVGVLRFDFARDLPKVRAARDADAAFAAAPMDGFRARDGRLLLVHGAADPVVSAWATVGFQQAASAARVGVDASAPDTHVRTFVVPGMNHCRGGPATDRFDALAAVVEWVEYARPPERIDARGSAVLREESRPLCPWPKVARYVGTGPLNTSASYACR